MDGPSTCHTSQVSSLPIFSPIDAIQELENCTLGDFNFVDKDVEILDVSKYAKHFP